MSDRTHVAGMITVALLLPSLFFITGILWFFATNFDHTEAKAISSFAGLEGGVSFAAVRWLLSKDATRAGLKKVLQGLVDLI